MSLRVLVFCGDLYHPVSTVRAGLAPLAAGGAFQFDWIEEVREPVPRMLEGHRVVLLSKSNVASAEDRTPWLAGAAGEQLRAWVHAGGGLLAVHSGTASYHDVPAVRDLLGGVFHDHPPPAAVTLEPGRDHPLGDALTEPFTVHDEFYRMILDDPAAEIFLRARNGAESQPAGWTRRRGRGRVCVLTPGHFPAVWLHPAFQRLLANSLTWVSPTAAAPNSVHE